MSIDLTGLSGPARPLLRIEKIQSTLDAWGRQLAPMLELDGTKKAATTISEFFFWELGFKGDSRSYYTPDNCFLDQVIQRRRGIPISISAMMSKGVDGIITDKPALAANIRKERESLDLTERMLIQIASFVGKRPPRPQQ